MPTYRVHLSGGVQHTVRALRFRADHEYLYLENRAAGIWRADAEFPLAEVEQVQRRLTEADGSWIWRTEPLPGSPSAG